VGDDEELSGRGGYSFSRVEGGGQRVTRVEGGGLPVPIEIVVDRAADGRYVFTGLVIGDGMQEITSATLRQIRLADILAPWSEWSDEVSEIERSIAEHSYPIRHSARGPDTSALLEFARTYLAELARHPHRAMTAAAAAHNISRATANRWAATCREHGYLPDPSRED
jgi:hypothetical protein